MKKALFILFLLITGICINAQSSFYKENGSSGFKNETRDVPDIDFSNAIKTVRSGNWSDPSVWEGGQMPSPNDDVVIDFGHDVYIDLINEETGQRIDLCKNLKIDRYATLFMGHNTDGIVKALQISGSLVCHGTFASGREIPEGVGEGLLYNYNSRIYFKLDQDTTYITGSGYFHPLYVNLYSPENEKQVYIDHYNMTVDHNFSVKSNDYRVTVTFDRYAYLNIKGGTLGLTGGVYQWSSEDAMSDIIVHGLIVTNDVGLFTKNSEEGEGSSLTIKQEGSLFTQSINQGETHQSEEAGFELIIEENGLFRCGEGVVSPLEIANGDPNFSIVNNGEIRQHYSQTLTDNESIMNQINAHKPTVNQDLGKLNDIFGASHIAGWYHFTERPFLLEGLDFYKEFGSTSIKTSLSAVNGKLDKVYPYNHSWPNFDRLVEVAQHEMMDSLFSRYHIKTHTFWATSKNKRFWKDGPDFNHEIFRDEEQQYYELTSYLLQKYGNTGKTFVYQNWEGDWMLRGSGVNWEDNPSNIPDDVEWRTEGMARLFRARQRGTERARMEFPEASAIVLHGIELNKLWASIDGDHITMMDNETPCVLANVIPRCRVDMTSWSAYDGKWSDNDNPFPVGFWKGLEMIDYFTTATSEIKDGIPVQVGEFAINENPPYSGYNEQEIKNRYDLIAGMSLALGIQNFYLWNFYCTGNIGVNLEHGEEYETDYLYEILDGKWVLEPDGSWGYAAEFLMEYFEDEDWNLGLPSITEKEPIKVLIEPGGNTIRLEMPFENVKIHIFDLSGRRELSQNYQVGNTVDVSSLSKGYYIIAVESPHGNRGTKFLKW